MLNQGRKYREEEPPVLRKNEQVTWQNLAKILYLYATKTKPCERCNLEQSAMCGQYVLRLIARRSIT